MKHFLPILFLFISPVVPAVAQHTEFSGRATLGLSCFGGTGATTATTVRGSFFDAAANDYSRDPYGQQLGAGFGTDIRAQYVSQHGLLAALEVGYDQAYSRAHVNLYDGTPLLSQGAALQTEAATGTTRLRTQAVPVFAGVGQRFGGEGAVRFDAVVGPEWAFLLAAHEMGQGTHSGAYSPAGTAWQIDAPHPLAHRQDWRLRADLTAWYRRLGLTASYALGLTDLGAVLADVPTYYIPGSVHSRTLRIGAAYRLF